MKHEIVTGQVTMQWSTLQKWKVSMYRPFYTAKPVQSRLGTPGNFPILFQVAVVKPRGLNPPCLDERCSKMLQSAITESKH